jgi:glucose 1-dehydrogenase
MTLSGKTALVTGASAGIGRATAIWLAEHGADVALDHLGYDESAEKARDQIVAMGRKAVLFRTDVSDAVAVEKMVADCVDKLGHLDILVSCAVSSERGPFYEVDMEGFRRTIDVTMWGAFNVVRSVSKHMIARQKGGNIVVVSSPHSVIPIANCMAYNMAKAGVDQMARTAALELIKHRIRVNLVHPGWTDTPGERKFKTEEELAAGAQELPWGRLAQPEEIARAIGFLVDDASDYITGSTVTIDAGYWLPWRDARF